MDVARWERAKSIFQEAIERPPADESTFLNVACGSDEALRGTVERLLRAHASAADFLTPARRFEVDDSPATLEPDTDDSIPAPSRIGPYRIVRELGRGGMGTVYLAERDDDPGLRKTVAIKVVRSGLDSQFIVKRFRTERQILAALEHPGIARLYDGGTTTEGVPYFVMEYVDGQNLLAYCDAQRCPIVERLQLFRRVCNAVQYAHQSFVVHRDLKPSNILITGDGNPKLLDFGIAKLVSPQAAGETADETAGFVRLLTPQYASPEQVRGERVTTASDVYSLGVILYELLSGHRPYRVKSRAATDIERAVCEEEPQAPSTVVMSTDVGGSGASASVVITPALVAGHRAIVPQKLRRRLRGELDDIVLKALRKDPGARYATATDLAEDVQRHLGGFPVRAQPDRRTYRLAKFVRRHRGAVTATVLVTFSLVGGLGMALWQARAARLERDRANARFADVRKLANALIFKIHDGVAPLAGSTPVRQMIVAEALTYLEQLSRDSGADDALRLELARGYHRIGDVQGKPSGPNLGDRQGAHLSYTKALALLRPMATGPLARDAALELGGIDLSRAVISINEGNAADAQAAVREAMSGAERLVRASASDPDARRLLGSAHFQLALMVDKAQSLAEWQQAGAIFDALLADRPDDPDRRRNVALVQKYIGSHFEADDDYTNALPHFQRALDLDEKRLAADPASRSAKFDVAVDLSSVAFSLQMTGKLPEAVAGFERCLAIREQLAAADPRDVQARRQLEVIHIRLGSTYREMGRLPEAIDQHRKAVAIGESLSKLDAFSQVDLAVSLFDLGGDEAQAGHRAASCDIYRRGLGVISNVERAKLSLQSERIATRVRADLADRVSRCK